MTRSERVRRTLALTVCLLAVVVLALAVAARSVVGVAAALVTLTVGLVFGARGAARARR